MTANSRSAFRSLLVTGLAALVLSAGAGAQSAAAQTSGVQSANLPDIEISAAPEAAASMAPVADAAPAPRREGPLNVHVFGDSLGDGIWAGLYRELPKADGYHVTKHSRVSTGLVRKDYYNWQKAVRQIVAKHRVDVAVVMIGTNDRQTIVENGRHALRSARWEEIYKARIDDVTQVLKDEGADIYWVELPAMRSPRFGGDMQYFNSLFRERAEANGIAFVPTRDRTLDDNGQYSAYGLDEDGRTRQMRTNDGIHFTMRGYIKLANFVTEAMAQPKAEVLPAPDPVVSDLPPVDGPVSAPVQIERPTAPVPPAVPDVALPQDPGAATPIPAARPDDRAGALPLRQTGEDIQRSERAGISDVASGIASALSDLRGFVMPEPQPGRADDLRQPAD